MGDGFTRREHLQAAAKLGDAGALIELEGPPLPAELEYLWRWYDELAGTAPAGMGPGTITHQQIESWCRLRRIHLTGLELDWLLHLDTRRLHEMSTRPKPGATKASSRKDRR